MSVRLLLIIVITTRVCDVNQEKALVGDFSVIVQPVMEPMDRFAALLGIPAREFRKGHAGSLLVN